MAPARLAIRGEARQDALGALHEYIPGLRINGRARSGVALVNRVAEEIVVKVLPELFTGLGVETSDPLLQVRAVTQITDDIEFAVGDHRSGLAGEIGDPKR